MAESSDDDDDGPYSRSKVQTGGVMQPSLVTNEAAAEFRVRKIAVRSLMGLIMVVSFIVIVWAGHLYLSALVVMIQVNCCSPPLCIRNRQID